MLWHIVNTQEMAEVRNIKMVIIMLGPGNVLVRVAVVTTIDYDKGSEVTISICLM